MRVIEVIMTSEPRATDSRMIAAKHGEIRDLTRSETFKVIFKKEIPEGANVLTGRFFLVKKCKVDGRI